MKPSSRITQLALQIWNRIIILVAQCLNNWQSKVSTKTRNRWVLSIIGILLMYSFFSLIVLFF
ncbi:hypothetical protein Q0590_00360 [Rhodocytophaga aerolata]|uniref:DUF2970 domain-containing protein n=1 Tax=Rhodocytophaga aerolata TaxID=455078 RepID=A0ABT8QXV8_9BACT|nr:hypothetical protein [Rhodocytophaga aerolata]MDO1444676.1 hypothetical protein [Rhodocytophaga aerolata]